MYCDVCGEELDEDGYPLCESEEEISEDCIDYYYRKYYGF
jgi:hypothetical protein